MQFATGSFSASNRRKYHCSRFRCCRKSKQRGDHIHGKKICHICCRWLVFHVKKFYKISRKGYVWRIRAWRNPKYRKAPLMNCCFSLLYICFHGVIDLFLILIFTVCAETYYARQYADNSHNLCRFFKASFWLFIKTHWRLIKNTVWKEKQQRQKLGFFTLNLV